MSRASAESYADTGAGFFLKLGTDIILDIIMGRRSNHGEVWPYATTNSEGQAPLLWDDCDGR
jgi:chloramphenicol 3-O-phosphotransferase